MQGRVIDIDKLRGSNEDVPAVGNMRVNARGDTLGPGGKIVKTKAEAMKEYYEMPKGAVSDAVTKEKVVQPRQEMPQPQPEMVHQHTFSLDNQKQEIKQPVVKKEVKPQVSQEGGIEEALKDLDD